jgi:putative transposase
LAKTARLSVAFPAASAKLRASAACFEHYHHIGHSPERMDHFSRDLLAVFQAHAGETFAWCVLPKHYHALVEAQDIKRLLHDLDLLHGRTSHVWNGEEQTRGRKVFFRVVERAMRSDRHYRATLNYLHHNPVRHGYAEHWTDWPWSSATEYQAQMGVWKRRSASGARTQCPIKARIGMNRRCKVWSSAFTRCRLHASLQTA